MIFRYVAMASSFALMLGHGVAVAQTAVSTQLGADGYWSNSSTWNPAIVPNNTAETTYDTTINEASVFLDQKAEVNSLSITNNSSLETLQPENLTVDTNFQNAGQSLFVSASNLLVKGNLSNTGSLETYNANAPTTGPAAHITVDGTLTNSGNGNVTLGGYAPDTLTVGTLVNDGAGNSGLPPSLSIPTGATLTVKNQLDLEGKGSLYVAGTLNGLGNLNQFTNQEELTLSGTSVLATPVFNGNTLQLGGSVFQQNGTSLTVNGNLSTSDFYQISGGNNKLNVSGAFSNSGQFSLQSAGDTANFGTFRNTGNLLIGGGTSVSLTGQPDGLTNIAAGSQLTVNGGFIAGGTSALANLNTVNGVLSVGNGTTIVDTPASGALTIGSGGSFTEQNGAFTVNGGLANQGKFLVDQTATITGALTGNGLVQISSGGTLNLGQAFTTVPVGEEVNVLGTLAVAGQQNALGLNAVNGTMAFANGQSQTIKPPSGTFNVTNAFYVGNGTTVTIQGNLNNSAPQTATDPAFPDATGLGASVLGTLAVTGTLNNTGYLFGGNIRAGAINNSGTVFFDQNPPLAIGYPENISVSGTYAQTGSQAITDLINPDEVLNAKTANIQGGSFTAYQLNANTLQIGAGAQVTLYETNLGGTPSAQTANPTAETIVASNGVLIDNGSLSLLSLPSEAGFTSAGSVTIGAGGSLGEYAGNYVQTGGTTVVNGSLTAPTVVVDGGVLTGTGTVDGNVTMAGGTIRSSGDPLTITGNLDMSAQNIFSETISGGKAFGEMVVDGVATLAGTLDISLLNGFFPVNGQQFVILQSVGGLSGTFASIDGLTFGPGGLDSWSISYGNDEVTLTANAPVAPVPEPGSASILATALLALGSTRLVRHRPHRGGWM